MPPRATLNLSTIARSALTLADEEGIEEFSMRRLADRLGIGTMSLYRYVVNKDELSDLMLDQIFSEITLPSRPSGDWRRDFTRLAISTRRVLLFHSWAVPLATRRPTLRPHYLRWFEFLLQTTASPRRTLRTQVRMVRTYWAWLSGFVAQELALSQVAVHEERRQELVRFYLERAQSGGRYPYLSQFFTNRLDAKPSDADFQFALQVLLEGLASASK